MKNEIGRKITSLTLMTIMLAGGMTIAFPGFTPDAYAVNANLIVSAENTGGYVDGAQIVEILIIDDDVADTASPDVTVGGDAVAMTRTTDGNWYAYIADTAAVAGVDNNSTAVVSGIDFGTGFTVGTDAAASCSITSNDSGASMVYCGAATTGTQKVPAATKTVATENASWPFIQTYSFSSTIEIQYNKAGGTQITTLSFDDNADGLSLDRSDYPLGATVHVTIGDHRLNIDPTSADIWTWNMDTGDKYYGSGVIAAINADNAPQVALAEAISASIEASLEYTRTAASNADIITNNVTEYVVSLDTPVDAAVITARDNISGENDKIIASLKIIEDAVASADTEDVATKAFAEVAKIRDFYQSLTQNYDDTGNTTLLSDLGLADDVVALATANTANAAITTAKDAVEAAARTSTAITANQVCVDCTVSITFNRLNPSGPDVLVVSAVDDRPLPTTDEVQWFTVLESEPNTAVFSATNLDDDSILRIADDVIRGSSALITYGVGADAVDTDVNVKHSEATIEIQSPDGVWISGFAIPIVVVDGDVNKNSQGGDDIDVADPDSIIPTLITGTPFTLGTIPSGITWWVGSDTRADTPGSHGSVDEHSATVETSSERANIAFSQTVNAADFLLIDFGDNAGKLRENVIDEDGTTKRGHNFINYDFESLEADVESIEIFVGGADGTVVDTISLDANEQRSGYKPVFTDNSLFDTTAPKLEIKLNFESGLTIEDFSKDYPIVIDFFSFGIDNDGEASDERIANQIIRLELEESDSDTGSLEGTLEYVMINQLIIVGDEDVYGSISPIGKDVSFIVIEDLTGTDAPSVAYLDVDANGAVTPVSAQEDAPSHSAVVTLNVDSLKTADTVTVTLEDLDLNTDSGLPDIYTVVTNAADPEPDADATNRGAVGSPYTEVSLLSDGSSLGRMLDITFDDQRWMTHTDENGDDCTEQLINQGDKTGLDDTNFSLIETGDATGIFVGTFALPAEFCREDAKNPESVTGLDIEVNYVDFRDQSGETTEVGDSAGVKANTGAVSLDRTVYPVPFGVEKDFDQLIDATTPGEGNTDTRSLFPIHQSGMSDDPDKGKTPRLDPGEYLPQGDLIVYVTVTDPDFDVSASGKDSIAIDSCYTDPINKRDRECKLTETATHNVTNDRSPVTVSVIRGSQDITVERIGGSDSPIDEIAPGAGIFEKSVTIRYHDGPDSTLCPSTSEPGNTPDPLLNGRIGDHDNDPDTPDKWVSSIDPRKDYCILQGDILQVEYNDPTDASGQPNTVTDSATFDLRNGVLQSDKSVYIIGSDMILTLIEPDLDLDSSQNETYDLDLIKWSSSAATLTMGDADGAISDFDPEPLSFRETGPSTGIFQIVIEIPQELDGDSLQRGEEIDLEYTDWGPAGSDYVGDQDEDIRLTVFTSNFGATIDLDQKVYSWTDKVYITIVAPDHNFDNDLIDEIGQDDEDPLRVATKGFDLDNYRLVETGFDTGIFTGEVILTGFAHEATGKGEPQRGGNGPTDGYLPTPSDGGISVSYEFSEDETVFTSSIIRWNIGDVQWLEASYPASGTGVLRVIDPDMNLNPEAVDNFDVNIASDTDASGITLTVTETNEATGIFEGTVFFTTTGGSSGHRLRVSEGDTVTADYADGTLPLPYTTNDIVSITSTTIIGTIVPPLERAPATNLRINDSFGSSIDAVSVDQQVQIVADLSNGQDRDQDFAYLIQIQDSDGVTVSLSWIAGSLSPGQSFSPSASWTPTSVGTYDVTAFVWESIDNPTALSPPLSIDISVN